MKFTNAKNMKILSWIKKFSFKGKNTNPKSMWLLYVVYYAAWRCHKNQLSVRHKNHWSIFTLGRIRAQKCHGVRELLNLCVRIQEFYIMSEPIDPGISWNGWRAHLLGHSRSESSGGGKVEASNSQPFLHWLSLSWSCPFCTHLFKWP